MGIKSKQIESLDASKVTQNDDRMFITKDELSRVGKLKKNVAMYTQKSDFPTVGETDVLYVATRDSNNGNTPTNYIYIDGEYKEVTVSIAELGDLKNLETTDKTNVVSAINECFQNANNGKVKIATAIKGKGVDASSNDTFSELADKIGKISSGGSTSADDLNYEDGTIINGVYQDDLKKNDIAFVKIADDISYSNELGGTIQYRTTCIATTKDNEYMMLGHSESPYVTFYKRENGKYKRLPLDIALEYPIVDCDISDDGKYFACIYSTSGYISVFRRIGDDFEQLEVGEVYSSTTRTTYSISVSSDGTYIGVGMNSSTGYFLVLKRNGDKYERLSNYTTSGVPTGVSNASTRGIDFYESQNKNYVAISLGASPYLQIQEFDKTSDTFTKLSVTGDLPTSALTKLRFSSTGRYIVLPTMILKFENDTLTKLETVGLSFSNVSNLVMNDTEDKLIVTTTEYPYAYICNIINDKIYYDKQIINSFESAITGAKWIHDEDAIQCVADIEPSYKEYLLSDTVDYLSMQKSTSANNLTSKSCCISHNDEYYVWGTRISPYLKIYKKNDDLSLTEITDIDIMPTGEVNSVFFTKDDSYLYTSHNNSPYITVYKRDGNTFTKLANPMELPPSTSTKMAMDETETYLAVGHAISPYLTIYKKNGETLTKLNDCFDVIPTGSTSVGDVCFTKDSQYMACVVSNGTNIYVYKRNGDVFTSISDGIEPISTTGTNYSIQFSGDGKYLVISGYGKPLQLYKRDGDVFTKLKVEDTESTTFYHADFLPNNKDIICFTNSSSVGYCSIYRIGDDDVLRKSVSYNDLMTTYAIYDCSFNSDYSKMICSFGRVASTTYSHPIYLVNPKGIDCDYYIRDITERVATSCVYSPDGKYLVLGYQTSPHLEIYKVGVNKYNRIGVIDHDTLGKINDIEYSKDGRYMAVVHSMSPYVSVYEVNDSTFTKLDVIDIIPTGVGRGVSFSRDDKYLAVSHEVSPYVSIYKKDERDGMFKKIANPSVIPATIGYGCSFSKTHDYFALSTNSSPYYLLYDYSGGTFELFDDLPVLPSSYYSADFDFSNNGEMFAICQNRGGVRIFTIKNKKLKMIYSGLVSSSSSSYVCENIRFSNDDKTVFVSLETTVDKTISKELKYSNGEWTNKKLSLLRETYSSTGMAIHPNGEHMIQIATGHRRGYVVYKKDDLNVLDTHLISKRRVGYDGYDKICLIQEDGLNSTKHDVKIIKDIYV